MVIMIETKIVSRTKSWNIVVLKFSLVTNVAIWAFVGFYDYRYSRLHPKGTVQEFEPASMLLLLIILLGFMLAICCAALTSGIVFKKSQNGKFLWLVNTAYSLFGICYMAYIIVLRSRVIT